MYPTLYKFGPVALHSFGLLLALGCIAAIRRASRISGRLGLAPDGVMDVGILMTLTGLVGGRVAYVALNWGDFAGDVRAMVAIWDGGLTSLGGFAVGTVAGVLWARRRGLDVAAFADMCAPSIALGYGIARLGCFLNGCCYGAPTTLPWAVRFRQDGGDALTAPCHPVQVYSFILNMLIFWALTRLEKRGLPAGRLFGSWLVLASLERFLMECFRRGATAQVLWRGMTQAQAVCLPLILVGALIIVRSHRMVAANV